MQTTSRFLCVLYALGFLAGCVRDDPPVIYPTTVKIDQSKFPLGPGDKLSLVVFYGSKSFNAAYALDSSGVISVQFIGAVRVGGKTVKDAEKEIQERLADGYINEPIVSLGITELNSLTLSVSGMVLKTGNIKYTPGMTITEVIAQSGGFSPMARKNMVKVTRNVEGMKQTYKLPVEKMAEGDRPNFEMLPGDDVFVPERAW